MCSLGTIGFGKRHKKLFRADIHWSKSAPFQAGRLGRWANVEQAERFVNDEEEEEEEEEEGLGSAVGNLLTAC